MRDDLSVVVENSVAGDVGGSVTQIGTVHGDVHVTTGVRPHIDYRSQVERIAPSDLQDRTSELIELADFCTAPHTEGRYVWWRAPAWSGKSALLSWFVLNPPPKVHLVSFFVTGRLADQNNRHAFLDNVLAQLLDLLGDQSPHHPADSTREAHFLSVLSDAARQCHTRGERLVLVVDGLDEDRGVDGSPDSHSIAALLPIKPPHGMRVVVSGRPAPPIPDDVPHHHPLHDPATVRTLLPSPKAQAMRHLMERDLKRLLQGTQDDQDLLGLLTASGGGLTTADLANLTDTSSWQVEDRFRTIAGRSFTRRMGHHPGVSPDVHLLAHDQLQLTALDMLGRRVEHYRQRLHTWADSYRDRRWPEDTPEYLLLGYFPMLTSTTDLPRMVACATDPHRHTRALALTGGDGAALTEITTTQNFLLSQAQPDLIALARLAIHRNRLHHRNNRVPSSLPAGWARAGQIDRAESMISSMRDPVHRIDALLSLATVVRKTGHAERAGKLLDQAEELARSHNQFWGALPLRSVAEAFATIGDYDRAEHIAHFVRDTAERVWALASLSALIADADAARATEFLDSAERLLSSEKTDRLVTNLGALAVAAAKMGRHTRATSLLDEAEAWLSSDERAAVGQLARYAASIGDHDRALRIVAKIGSGERAEPWLTAIIAIIASADPDRAETIAQATADAGSRCSRLATVAGVMERRGDRDRATHLITEAESTARNIADRGVRSDVLMSVAETVADMGDLERAMELVRQHITLCRDADRVLSVAAAVLRADDLVRGAELLHLAEDLARVDIDPSDEKRSVLWVVVVTDFGDFDRAERLARSLRDHTARSAAWAAITEGATAAGLLDRAEMALASIDDPTLQRRPRVELLRAVMATGDFARAEIIAYAAPDPVHRTGALTIVAEATRSGTLLDTVEQTVRSLPGPVERLDALACLLRIAAHLGDRPRTTALLSRVEAAAHAVEDAPDEEHPTGSIKARNAMRRFPRRLRTLTEVAEMAAHLTRGPLFERHNDHTSIIPAQTPWPKAADLPPHQALARKLCEQDWYHCVEELVELLPDAYPAIITELEASSGSLPA